MEQERLEKVKGLEKQNKEIDSKMNGCLVVLGLTTL